MNDTIYTSIDCISNYCELDAKHGKLHTHSCLSIAIYAKTHNLKSKERCIRNQVCVCVCVCMPGLGMTVQF